MILENTTTMVNENTVATRTELTELTADQLNDVIGGMRVSDAQAAANQFQYINWVAKLYTLFHLW